MGDVRFTRSAIVWIGLLVCSVDLFLVDGAAGLESSLEIQYNQRGTFDGNGTAQLNVQQIMFFETPARVRVLNATGSLLTVSTQENRTIVANSMAAYDPVDPVQSRKWRAITPGQLEMVWPNPGPNSALRLRGGGYTGTGPEGSVNLSTVVTSATWGSINLRSQGLPHYWFDSQGDAGWSTGGVAGWSRVTRLDDQAVARIQAPFMLQFREAELWADGQRIVAAEPYARVDTITVPGVPVTRQHLNIVDHFLEVTTGEMVLSLRGTELAVRDAAWDVDGAMTLQGAIGDFRVGGFEGAVRNETISAEGSFQLIEVVPQQRTTSEGDRSYVNAQARGEFAIVAVDYVVRAAGDTRTSLVEQALWLTLALTVLSAMFWLSKQGLLGLYSRLSDDAVLTHPRRAEIMEFIKQNPACHVLGLSSELGIARGVARHHLLVLERAGKVRRFQEQGQTLLVPAGQPRAVALKALAQDDERLAAIRAMAVNKGMLRMEMVSMLRMRYGVADPTARRWIQKAVRLGLVTEEGTGHGVAYRAND